MSILPLPLMGCPKKPRRPRNSSKARPTRPCHLHRRITSRERCNRVRGGLEERKRLGRPGSLRRRVRGSRQGPPNRDDPIGAVTIFSAIARMTSDEPGPGQQYALEARRHITALRAKEPNIQIEIRWCPSHQGIEGNETADEWAKLAADEPDAHGVECHILLVVTIPHPDPGIPVFFCHHFTG